jgi:DNA-binding beta-propeller fold protein YncE
MAALVGVAALLFAWTSTATAQDAADILSSPIRLAFDNQGGLAVSDPGARRVVFLDPASHTILQSLNIKGKPLGIAFLGNRLLVGNKADDNVEVYQRNNKGDWKRKKPLGGGKHGVLVPYPLDIDVDEGAGRIYALSGNDKIVMVFNSDGKWLYSFPPPCADPKCSTGLVAPNGIAVDTANGHVIVSDGGDPSGFFSAAIRARTQIYNLDGSHKATLSGESGQAGFEFSRPMGVGVDAVGRIFLTDALLSQVLVFQEIGGQWTGVSALGSFGFGPEQLALPMDAAVDAQTLDVLVVSNRAGRIVFFQQGGVLP